MGRVSEDLRCRTGRSKCKSSEQRWLKKRDDWSRNQVRDGSNETDAPEIPRDEWCRDDGGDSRCEKVLADSRPQRPLIRGDDPARKPSARNQAGNSDNAQLVTEVENCSGMHQWSEGANGECRPRRCRALSEF